MRSEWCRLIGVAGMVVWAVPLAVGAQELTGSYAKEGGELSVLQGDNETLVRYDSSFAQGQSVGSCECPFVVTKKSAGRWTLSGEDVEGEWALRVGSGKLVLEGSGLGCCGAGFPGRDEFNATQVKPPVSCKVKAPRAYFHASDAANTQRKAYVVAGDTVEALMPASEPDLVPARFKGARDKTTVGLIERKQLECGAPGATASAGTSGVEAARLQPLAGTWISLTKKGKGHVISKPCSAETPSFTLQASSARMDIQLGQESLSATVTKLEPGAAAGAYVLELTQEGGTREQVQWKVTDAGRGLVSLSSPLLFPKGSLYVRGDKKAAFPVEAEKNCDEYE